MSCADDQEFVRQMLKANEEFVVKQLTSMNKLLNEQKSTITKLQERVVELENRDMARTECRCTAQVKLAFEAAMRQMDDPVVNQELRNQDLDVELVAMTGLTPMGFYSSTPRASKRKAPHTATSEDDLVTDIDMVADEKLRNAIRPFYKTNRCATKDLLNRLQRAFVKYNADTLIKNPSMSITGAYALQVIEHGVTHKLWRADWTPGENDSLETYIMGRLKNEKKNMRNKESVAQQTQHMADMLSRSLVGDVSSIDQTSGSIY